MKGAKCATLGAEVDGAALSGRSAASLSKGVL